MRHLSTFCAGLLAAATVLTTPAIAQERETLGVGRLFTNDFFGDNKDRWRTGSYTFSILRGTEWTGDLATTSGPLLEYRLGSSIIAPSALNGVGSDDRAYVGALSAGLHTHFNQGGAEISTGIDLVFTGPQTGLSGAQDWFHDIISAPNISDSVINAQVANAVYPTAVGQVVYPIKLNPDVMLRPFVEAQYGVEDFVRVGGDVVIGDMLQNDLWMRDPTTGQLYSAIEDGQAGTGFVIGADYTLVNDSAYFPASFGTVAEDERFRARAGVHWRFGGGLSYFYGLTYLSEEFEGQSQGQVLGSLKLNFNF